MKALAILSLSLVSTMAMAGRDDPPKPPTTQSCTTCPEVNINAPSIQLTSLTHTAVLSKSENGGSARQNLASNSGNVNIEALSIQAVVAKGSFIANHANGNGAVATQNLASNLGKVNVEGGQLQVVAAKHSFIGNYAGGGSSAVQNISSNNGCSTCN